MKIFTRESCVFTIRTFAAGMLALYVSYYLALPHPVWALQTAYAVSGPLAGIGKLKSADRMCGTICGAIFTIIALPTLVNAPELLVVAISSWIGLCLYLSITHRSQRPDAFVLAGFTVSTLCFISVHEPQVTFFAVLARTEEIGLGILCVHLMSYLPFHSLAGDALLAQINRWGAEAKAWAIQLMHFSQEDIALTDRSQMIIEARMMENLHNQAHYDTPRFANIEGWVIRLRRNMQTFFGMLVTLESQIKMLKAENPAALARLKPVSSAMIDWIESGETTAPQALEALIADIKNDVAARDLVKNGIIDTLSGFVPLRSTSLDLRSKIESGVETKEKELPIARYIDYRQATVYGLTVMIVLSSMSAFWIISAWPAGPLAAMMSAVIFCLFSTLESPGKMGIPIMAMVGFGALVGWFYNFIVFPGISGFVPMVISLGLVFLPLGLLRAHPKLGVLALPTIISIILIDFQNNFSAEIDEYLNNVIAMIIGIGAAIFSLGLMRSLNMSNATERLLTENGRSLAVIARDNSPAIGLAIDHMGHRATMVLQRAPSLNKMRSAAVSRVLLDFQAGLALQQIKAIMPRMPPALQTLLQKLQAEVAAYFDGRHGLRAPKSSPRQHIRALMQEIDRDTNSHEAMRLVGFLNTLNYSLGSNALQEAA